MRTADGCIPFETFTQAAREVGTAAAEICETLRFCLS